MINLTNAVQENLPTNYHGTPTYHRELAERVVQVLTMNTLGNTFYAKGSKLVLEAIEVLRECAMENPEFLAKACVYARTEGLMKDLPVMGLVILSTAKDKAPFRNAFNRVVLIPDDLRNFVQICRSGQIKGRKGFGGCVVEPVRQWLNNMSEYHTVKYGSKASKSMTMRDILRLCHPKPADAAVSERFGWLCKGWESVSDEPSKTNPLIWALEKLKGTTDKEEVNTLLEEYSLPFEVVVPTVSSTGTEVWERLLRKAPYFNLLRSLNTYARHGVFKNEANVEYAVQRLTNQQAIQRSRVLPFRFFDAWKAFTRNNSEYPQLAEALRTALERSFVNLPSFGDLKLAIGSDVSGSMMWEFSPNGTTSYLDICAIFTAALLKKSENLVYPLPFNHEVVPCQMSKHDSLLSSAEKLTALGGGGTAIGAPAEYLIDHSINVDVFIGITDNEDWAYGHGYYCRGSFLDAWRRYKSMVNPDAKAFLVTIAPYGHAVAPSDEPDVHFIYGWSDRVLKYISTQLQSNQSQVDAVESIDLE